MSRNVTALIEQHFGFLEHEYGFVRKKVPADRWDRTWLPSVGYSRDPVGVLVQYEARDAYLNVILFQLQGGAFPLRGGRIATARGYPLNGAIFLTDPPSMIAPWSGPEEAFPDYFAEGARKLRTHCGDVLQGDFRRLDEIAAATQQLLAARTAPPEPGRR